VQQAVWAALGKLSPEHRSAVVLHYLLGMKQATVAERVGAPVGTVKRRLHEARRRLRGLLGGLDA
jgi:RNA polymerase sigma-70 factor (ECF subfamily)